MSTRASKRIYQLQQELHDKTLTREIKAFDVDEAFEKAHDLIRSGFFRRNVQVDIYDVTTDTTSWVDTIILLSNGHQ